MGQKYGDVRWKWLEERGFKVISDRHQYAYMQSLWTPSDLVQAVFCESRAGTGKTTLAVLAGAYEVEKGNYDRIIYIRNTIPVRDQGFLPGGEGEKEAPYMRPFIDSLEYVKPGTYKEWSSEENPRAVALSTSYTRGITWKNAFIIIDEAQSFDLDEFQTIYTRIDDSCKIVTTGSLRQNDNRKLRKFAGYTPFEIYMKHYEGHRVTYHKLETNYRGWFSNHADDVGDTIERLKSDEVS